MSAETQNEMERLRREQDQAREDRDEAFAKGKQVFEDLRRVEAERDALAAQVEDVRAACISGGQWAERVIAIGRVLNQSPTTSLARLKAQWQAEALQQLADDYYGEINPRTVANRAAELRRQAEGGE